MWRPSLLDQLAFGAWFTFVQGLVVIAIYGAWRGLLAVVHACRARAAVDRDARRVAKLLRSLERYSPRVAS